MTTPDVRCTCVGTCHPEAQEDLIRRARQIAPDDDRLVESSGDAETRAASAEYARRVLAATDHIGRGTRNV